MLEPENVSTLIMVMYSLAIISMVVMLILRELYFNKRVSREAVVFSAEVWVILTINGFLSVFLSWIIEKIF